MAETAIEWADDTVNVASGCTEHRRLDGSMDPACVKQWGEWAPICAIGETNHLYHPAPKRRPDGTRRCRVPELILRADGNHRRAGDPESFRSDRPGWPAMHAFKVGKHAAGRMLDGVVHDAYPQVPGATP